MRCNARESVSGDTLTGKNFINGASGNDKLKGALGNDAFFRNTTPNAATNRDTITDFSASAPGNNNDTIRLENAVFKALVGTGTLSVELAVDEAVAITRRDLSAKVDR